jgi:hypothetical protein
VCCVLCAVCCVLCAVCCVLCGQVSRVPGVLTVTEFEQQREALKDATAVCIWWVSRDPTLSHLELELLQNADVLASDSLVSGLHCSPSEGQRVTSVHPCPAVLCCAMLCCVQYGRLPVQSVCCLPHRQGPQSSQPARGHPSLGESLTYLVDSSRELLASCSFCDVLLWKQRGAASSSVRLCAHLFSAVGLRLL